MLILLHPTLLIIVEPVLLGVLLIGPFFGAQCYANSINKESD
jgi:hypothetical protein